MGLPELDGRELLVSYSPLADYVEAQLAIGIGRARPPLAPDRRVLAESELRVSLRRRTACAACRCAAFLPCLPWLGLVQQQQPAAFSRKRPGIYHCHPVHFHS